MHDCEPTRVELSMVSQSTATPSITLTQRQQVLERRLAVAKAELLWEQDHRNKKQRQVSKLSKAEEQQGKADAFLAYPETPDSSSKKDSAAHYIYLEVSQTVHEKLLRPSNKVLTKGSVVGNIILDILQNGDSGDKYIKGNKKVPIDGTLLLDNFVSRANGVKDAHVRALRSHSKRSRRHMSMRQHRKCGSFDLPRKFHKFDLFKPMHDMWKEYVIELLAKSGNKHLAQCIFMADLHGAILHVVECKTTAFKGVNGIIIRETAETFGLITQDNKFRAVPKQGSVFIFQAGCWKIITLQGDKLSVRNAAT